MRDDTGVNDLTGIVEGEGPVRLGIRLGPMLEFPIGTGTLSQSAGGGVTVDGRIDFSIMGQTGDGACRFDLRPGDGDAWDFALLIDGTIAGRVIKRDETHSATGHADTTPEDPTLVLDTERSRILVYRRKAKLFLDLGDIVPELPGQLYLEPTA